MIWVPVALVVIGLLAFLLLMGMPFGGRKASRPPLRQQPQFDVVNEREGAPTATVGEIRGPVEEITPPPVQQPTASVAPPPLVDPAPAASPAREPKRAGREISEADAMEELRNYILSRRDYGVSRDCLVISSQGYLNRGYTLHAFDRCGESSMGMWRVDAETRDVYRRQGDGRYLRP